MVATLDDWRAARAQLAAARSQVQAHGQPAADRIATGIMVEVPSAVLLADQFAAEVDFLSIGTNDLAQYVYAADRGDAATSALADGFGPALLRCLRQVIEAAHARQRPVTVCGELASDPLAIPLLLGLGVDELSMAPSALSDARLTVQSLDLAGARTMATAALAGESAAEVRGLATAYQKR
jgi:phosphoenolpyruvate-protein kinase (PTS system EI component)